LENRDYERKRAQLNCAQDKQTFTIQEDGEGITTPARTSKIFNINSIELAFFCLYIFDKMSDSRLPVRRKHKSG